METSDFSKIKAIHFIGIGGIGISAIARMFLVEGKRVSGSDLADSEVVGELRKLGADIRIGENDAAAIPKDTDFVVYTTAIEVSDTSFYKKLKELPIPSISYAEALGLISAGKKTIAVSGTHGKTTTTAMIAKIMMDAGLDPTVIVGSFLLGGSQGSTLNRLPATSLAWQAGEKGRTFDRTNFIAGKSDYLVLEVDEYQRKFLTISPTILVVTNVDEDHLDYFKDLADIQSAFAELAAKVPKEGAIITDLSRPNIATIVKVARAPILDYCSVDISGLKLKFPGRHNIDNARAALMVSDFLGVDHKKALTSLNNFQGTWRRFEYLGETKSGALVYDDYAHNPQKVQAVLAGARELFPGKKIIAIFQPHLFSRTKMLFQKFAQSFGQADEVLLAPIFPAREKFDPTISSEMFRDEIKKYSGGKIVESFRNSAEILAYLESHAYKNNVVITIGAGDIYKVAESLVQK